MKMRTLLGSAFILVLASHGALAAPPASFSTSPLALSPYGAADNTTVGGNLLQNTLAAQLPNKVNITGGSAALGSLAVTSAGTFVSGQQGVSASVLVNGLQPSAAYGPEAGGNFSNDALSVTMAVPANSTPSTAPFQNNGIASYVSAASAPGTSNGTPGGTVSGYFLAFAAGNGPNLFGINPVCDDRNFSNVTCQNEFDIVVRNTSTNVNGIDVKISGSNSPANGSGVLIANAGTTAVHYPYGFTTTDGAALVGLRLGSQAGLAGVGATSISQVALLRSYDATSPNPVLHVAKFYSDQNGQLIFQSGQAGQAITFQDYSATNGTSGTTFFTASTAGYTMQDFTSAGILTTTNAGALGSLSSATGTVLAGQGSGSTPAFTAAPTVTNLNLLASTIYTAAGGNIQNSYSGTGIINVDFTGATSSNGPVFRFFRSTTGAASTGVQILNATNANVIQDYFEANGPSYMQAVAGSGGLTVGSATAIPGSPELGVAGSFGVTGTTSLAAGESHAYVCQTASFAATTANHNAIIAGSCPTNSTPSFGALTANVTETLPACGSATSGFTFGLKKEDSSSYTVSFVPASGNNAQTGVADTIDGASTSSISAQYGTKQIQCDGYGHWASSLQ